VLVDVGLLPALGILLEEVGVLVEGNLDVRCERLEDEAAGPGHRCVRGVAFAEFARHDARVALREEQFERRQRLRRRDLHLVRADRLDLAEDPELRLVAALRQGAPALEAVLDVIDGEGAPVNGGDVVPLDPRVQRENHAEVVPALPLRGEVRLDLGVARAPHPLARGEADEPAVDGERGLDRGAGRVRVEVEG
jgi:hypothetical protein